MKEIMNQLSPAFWLALAAERRRNNACGKDASDFNAMYVAATEPKEKP